MSDSPVPPVPPAPQPAPTTTPPPGTTAAPAPTPRPAASPVPPTITPPPAPPVVAAPAAVPAPPTPTDAWWTKPALALSNKAIFLIVLLAAYVMKLENVIAAFAGYAAAMAMNPDTFYFGSSEGSRAKDTTIAAQQPKP